MGAMWNGEKCSAEKGSVVCGNVEIETWWCKKFEGERIPCVRVDYQGQIFFLADDDGSGSHKVFNTPGGPWDGPHKSIPVDDPRTFALEV